MPSRTNSSERNAYIITGPTSGIGYRTALELAKHGTVVLVGRDPVKLAKVQKTIEQRGGRAMSIVPGPRLPHDEPRRHCCPASS